jgi:hypothetical protein
MVPKDYNGAEKFLLPSSCARGTDGINTPDERASKHSAVVFPPSAVLRTVVCCLSLQPQVLTVCHMASVCTCLDLPSVCGFIL